ncbi:bifunctional hydroxymethylpyrimidine kinase/phosphomethylpyrimidine kinase [Iodidimonas sp. SYSU 1G8]|uniref:bifunctional hydroxymethylpyrimidine kinase/phosphomethylpyrimidine kinase n=1 Tax=Iodidimonas sp. SYSU 1G8 TaxID=3133967 RepID=UPI0031FF14AF
MKGRVLIIAGSDSGGGAGIQADIKAVSMLGGFAATAITALTAQNTLGVHGILGVDPDFIRHQMQVVLRDIGADALKTGMLHSAEVIEAVASVIEEDATGVPLVVDPVMVAKGGAALLQDSAAHALVTRMIPKAALLTPNLPEAEVLTGFPVTDLDGMRRAASALLKLGPGAVLVKGGHLEHPTVLDLLLTERGETVFESRRIDTQHTHGTGCTLASAIATGLAQGLAMERAVARARDYVHRAIETAPGFGHGHGPLNHGHPLGGD